MNFNCSDELKQLHAQYVQSCIDAKDYCGSTSGCESGEVRSCDKSRNWVGVHYHDTLREAARHKLNADIGDKHGQSVSGRDLTIGCCAEQHAANNVLNHAVDQTQTDFDVTSLTFTPAMRPKGKKFMDPCENCNTLF